VPATYWLPSLLSLPLIFISAAFVAAQTREAGATLVDAGLPVQLGLVGGESKTVRIHAQSGDYLQILAASDSQLVVKTSLFDPAGQLVAVTPSLGGTGGSAQIAAYAATSGDFLLRVTSQMLNAEVRTCTITLALRRPASESDRIDAEAHQAFAKAAAEATKGSQGMRSAISLLDRPIELARRAGDSVLELRAIFGKGQFLAMLGDLPAAVPFFTQALELCRKAGNQRAEAHTLDDLGLVTANLEHYPDAIEYYNRALELQQKTAQPWETALTLSNLADAESALGRIDIALECLERQERIRKDLKDEFGLNETWLGMADVYLMTGDPERALEKLIATEPHWPRFRDKEDGKESEINTYRKLGLAYAALGNYESAEAAMRTAMKLARALGNARVTADTLVVAAQLSPLHSDAAQSLRVIQDALAASRAADYKRGEALALIEQGKLQIASGELRSAPPLLEKALAIAIELEQPYDEANARRVLGMAHAALGETVAAEREYTAALGIQRRIGDRFGEVQTLVEAARLQDRIDRPERAAATLDKALAVIDQTRSSLAAPELRASYLASQRAAYELSARVLVRLDERSPGESYSARAFNVSERAHARTLLDALGNRGGELDDVGDRKLVVRLNALDAALHGLASSEQSVHREQHIAELLTERNQLELELRSQRTADSPQAEESTIPLPVIREQLLRGNTVLLEYLTGPQQTHMWVVSRAGLRHYTLPGEAVLQSSVRRLYDSLTAADRLPSNLTILKRHDALALADVAASRETDALARVLLPMPPALLGKSSILIVADGPIQLVPFAFLPAPGDPSRKLGNLHTIAFEPSASVLARMQQSHKADRNERVLIVADPVFSRSDPRLAGHGNPDPSAGDRRIDALPPLPMSRVEAERLGSLAQGRATTLLDFDAVPAKFDRLAAGPFSIIHIATHTLLDDRHPDLSGLVLSMLDRKGRRIDGFLPLLDIYKLHLETDLVVLSACETYIGNDLRGEGLLGLARGFLYAGARQVVASLWKVDDRATAAFMQHFYTALLRDKIGALDALSRAQNEMSKDPAWRSPRYWAGFVLEGDPH
jgi:CHAT domain-containing protein/tetratricopeptide (TPR) repeat protein